MRSKPSVPSSARSVAGSLGEVGPLSPAKADGDWLDRYKLRDTDSSSNGSNGWIPAGFSGHKMASYSWVAAHVKEWLIEKPTLGPKELQRRLKDKYKIEVSYFKVWAGKEVALEQIYGSWAESFDQLYNFKAEIEKRYQGSIVEIDYKVVKEKFVFSKVFVALKPCIDGFLNGCRPYLGVDSTFLTGRYRGQLASATAIDGHNWMYPVAYGIFESEAKENWEWFLSKLKLAIGSPRGLAIHTDAGHGITAAVAKVFPEAEHRECMMHMWKNLIKTYQGDVIDKNMWPAARAFEEDVYDLHMSQIQEANPKVIKWLKTNHPRFFIALHSQNNSDASYC